MNVNEGNNNENGTETVKDESTTVQQAPTYVETEQSNAGSVSAESIELQHAAEELDKVSTVVEGSGPAIPLSQVAQPPAPNEDFPPEPALGGATSEAQATPKPFPPEPQLGQNRDTREVWAQGRLYGSLGAAAAALGLNEDTLRARIASSDEQYATFRWNDK